MRHHISTKKFKLNFQTCLRHLNSKLVQCGLKRLGHLLTLAYCKSVTSKLFSHHIKNNYVWILCTILTKCAKWNWYLEMRRPNILDRKRSRGWQKTHGNELLIEVYQRSCYVSKLHLIKTNFKTTPLSRNSPIRTKTAK